MFDVSAYLKVLTNIVTVFFSVAMLFASSESFSGLNLRTASSPAT
jgi:hypothetical protein